MNSVFTTKRTRSIQIGNDIESWIEPLNDLYVSNREFMNLTNKPSDSYKDLIRKELQESKNEGRSSLAILREGDSKVIGFLEFWEQVPTDKKPWIGLCMIHQDVKRTGIGREVIEGFLQYASTIGCKEIRIGVDIDNHTGYQFWKSIGFLEYDQKEITHPNGARLAKCMEMQLQVEAVC